MGHFKVNPKDIFFILKEQLNYSSLCTLDRYKDLNEKTLDLLVMEAMNFAKGVVAPLNEIGEKQGITYDRGTVCCPSEFKAAFRQYGEDGWIAAARDLEYGGQGFPHMSRIIINDLMYGASQAFNMAPSLTHGAGHLIESFGTDALKKIYLPNMFSGKWSGTMCLTEADSGSNLATIQTMAVRQGDHFKISGKRCLSPGGNTI